MFRLTEPFFFHCFWDETLAKGLVSVLPFLNSTREDSIKSVNYSDYQESTKSSSFHCRCNFEFCSDSCVAVIFCNCHRSSDIAMSIAKVYIIFYSTYGHVEAMAREVQRGASSVEGVEATLWQVPETLPDRVLEKMKAPPKPDDVPKIRPEQLVEADGFLFGSPSRFGMMAAQVKAFFDATHDLWATQALAGKPAGVFWSTGFHGGGQELTAFTAITQFAHHGMIFVPLGYTFGSGMFEMNQVKGGSSYGAGTFAADGSRQPTDLELQQAFYQGKYMAQITKKLKGSPPLD